MCRQKKIFGQISSGNKFVSILKKSLWTLTLAVIHLSFCLNVLETGTGHQWMWTLDTRTLSTLMPLSGHNWTIIKDIRVHMEYSDIQLQGVFISKIMFALFLLQHSDSQYCHNII